MEIKAAELPKWAYAELSARGAREESFGPARVDFSEQDLIRELAWVILCSGFRERTVRSLFGRFSLCFLDWESCEAITHKADICTRTALDVFGSRRKIDAIVDAARRIVAIGFEDLRAEIRAAPAQTLISFQYIGKITALHLAKNLGADVAKPDRHLQRLSRAHGYEDVQEFCGVVSARSKMPIHQVDTVLWRLSTLGFGHLILSDVRREHLETANRTRHAPREPALKRQRRAS